MMNPLLMLAPAVCAITLLVATLSLGNSRRLVGGAELRAERANRGGVDVRA